MRKVLLAAAFMAALSMPAGASVIDTTTTFDGTIAPFGAPNTATYGQTFTAAGSQLLSFSLFLQQGAGPNPLDLRVYIGTWTGSHVGEIVFASGTETMPLDADTWEFAYAPDIALTAGNDYVAFLSISDLPEQSASAFVMPGAGDVIAGNFVFLNNGTDASQWTTTDWSSFDGADVWFRAEFSDAAVPEPLTLTLFGAGLVGVGMLRRRARRA